MRPGSHVPGTRFVRIEPTRWTGSRARVCSHGMLETLADAFPLPVHAHFAPCGTRAQWKLGQLTRIHIHVYVETTSSVFQRGIERDVTWCFCRAVISVSTRPKDWKEVEEWKKKIRSIRI